MTTLREGPDEAHPLASPSSGARPAPAVARRRGRHAMSPPQSFRAVLGWTLVGGLIPGAGLIAAGRRRSGAAVLATAGLLVAVVAVAAVRVDPLAAGQSLVADPNRLVLVAVIVGALSLAWGLVVVVTHLALRRGAHLTGAQSVVGGLLVVTLLVVVGVPAAVAGNDALVARRGLNAVFGNGDLEIHRAAPPRAGAIDPWAGVPRVNVLLLGGDAGADRTGIRPDTMILASIDTHSGDTVLLSLPRNLQHVPFPPGSPGAAQYPNGFYCINPATGDNTECLLNGLWTWGDDHPQDYPGDPHPGLTATIQGAEQVTGLPVTDYVMLNLAGFQQLVDILGGLTVNVTERLPVGGNVENPVASSWLEPGVQKLNGYLALWYARSRWSTTDYDRMLRQRCVIGDFVRQVDPLTVALKFDQFVSTLQQNLQTSIPLTDLSAWVTLAQRVRTRHVRSLTFTDQVIDTVDPDIQKMHALVQQALVVPSATPASSAPATSGHSSAPAPTADPSQAQDVTQVC